MVVLTTGKGLEDNTLADLSKMTRKQLETLISNANRALKKIETKEKREAKKAAEKAAAKFGFKLNELVATKTPQPEKRTKPKPKSPAVAKYADPADKTKTWTGKGRQPAWYKQAVEAGVDPKSMEV